MDHEIKRYQADDHYHEIPLPVSSIHQLLEAGPQKVKDPCRLHLYVESASWDERPERGPGELATFYFRVRGNLTLHVENEELLPSEGAELEAAVSPAFPVVPLVGRRVAFYHGEVYP